MQSEEFRTLINNAVDKLKQAKIEDYKDYIMSAIEDIDHASEILLNQNDSVETSIVDSTNWIEKLQFMNQNTSYTIDTVNRTLKVITNVRAAIFSFKIDNIPLNTDVEGKRVI
ncbi:hypothetical protein [Turicibacter bilis]|uniref:hypothetical protein n=1 Tax=Turicibacter bilis TaxID=2735723 RepID=UPI0031BA001A